MLAIALTAAKLPKWERERSRKNETLARKCQEMSRIFANDIKITAMGIAWALKQVNAGRAVLRSVLDQAAPIKRSAKVA